MPSPEPAPGPDLVLVIPSQTRFLCLVRETTAALARGAGFEDAVAERVALAVDEAVTNAIEHAYRGAPDREVEIRAGSAAELWVEVVDAGARVDARDLPRFDLERYAREGRRGGIGVHLMGEIMDEVRHERRGDRNVCRLVRRRPSGVAPASAPGALQLALRRSGQDGETLREVARLAALAELAALGGASPEARLSAGLLAGMGQLAVGRAGLYARDPAGRLRLRIGRGPDLPEALAEPEAGRVSGFADTQPVGPGGVLGLLAWGDSARASTAGDRAFAASLCGFLAGALQSERDREERQRLVRSLTARVYQLHNLFDLSQELTRGAEAGDVLELVAAALMGQLGVSRCALYLAEGGALRLALARGPRGAPSGLQRSEGLGRSGPLGAGPDAEALRKAGLEWAVPLRRGPGVGGLIALGPRLSGARFGAEDEEFATALGGQALAALEGIRLRRVQVEKERQDREMEVARRIQRGLLPRRRPSLAGYDLAAETRPSRLVGGDYFDHFALPGGRLALVVADVSGKGSGASILMASVHAWLRARAGAVPPAELLRGLNEFLFAGTEPNKFVTLVHAELDPPSGRLTYVNAGHVPPYRLPARGEVERLTRGGPVLGLLEEVSLETGELSLEVGDLLVMLTDGVTEALSEGDREFGEARTLAALEAARRAGESAEAVVGRVVAEVEAWSGRRGFSDDLTALALRVAGRP